jgi:hexosaminidase
MAGRGHPELLTRCHNKALPALGPMDPTKNSTWELLHTLFEELTTVFPDAFMHLGGDEVRPNPNPYPNRSG